MARSRSRDEDDGDRPVRKKKRKKSNKAGATNRRWLLLGVGGGAVVLVGAVAALALFLLSPPRRPVDSPQTVFADFQAAVAANDHGRVFELLHPDGLDLQAAQIEAALVLEPEMRKHSGKKGRELWVAYCQEQEKKGVPPYGLLERWRSPATVEGVAEDGETATLTVKAGDGRTEAVRMKKHNGAWRYRPTWFG